MEKFAKFARIAEIEFSDIILSTHLLDLKLRVYFKDKSYLDFLTLYENAPGIKRREGIEDGLGQYAVETISKDAIVLKRKKKVLGGYNTVSFYEYTGKKDPNLQNRNIKDFNLIAIFDVPEWVVREYYGFNTVEMKSMNLIINHPDLKVRKSVYNCLNTARLRNSLFPEKRNFYAIQTILPIGVLGARGGAPRQECDSLKSGISVPLKFANWDEAGRVTLTEYINSINKSAGMNIQVVNYDPRELIKTIHSSPHPYNLLVIALETIQPDYPTLFSYFFSKNGFYDFRLDALQLKYENMLKEENISKKNALAVQLAQELADKALVLPLYQNVKTLYYPKEIKHLAVGKGFLQYPDVAALQI